MSNNFEKFIIYFIFFFLFFNGILEIGGVPSFLLTAILTILTIILFLHLVFKFNDLSKYFKTPFYRYFASFLMAFSITFFFTKNLGPNTIKYIILLWLPYIFFLAIYNLQKKNINVFVFFSFFIVSGKAAIFPFWVDLCIGKFISSYSLSIFP